MCFLFRIINDDKLVITLPRKELVLKLRIHIDKSKVYLFFLFESRETIILWWLVHEDIKTQNGRKHRKFKQSLYNS